MKIEVENVYELIRFSRSWFKGQGHRNVRRGGITIDGSPSTTVLFVFYCGFCLKFITLNSKH